MVIDEKAIQQIVEKYYDGYGLRLICYACPRITWIPTGNGQRDWVLRHDHIYDLDIKPIGGRIRIKLSENNVPVQVTLNTWKELYKWLMNFVNERAITAIEVITTAIKTAWEDAETYDRLFDTATLRFLQKR